MAVFDKASKTAYNRIARAISKETGEKPIPSSRILKDISDRAITMEDRAMLQSMSDQWSASVSSRLSAAAPERRVGGLSFDQRLARASGLTVGDARYTPLPNRSTSMFAQNVSPANLRGMPTADNSALADLAAETRSLRAFHKAIRKNQLSRNVESVPVPGEKVLTTNSASADRQPLFANASHRNIAIGAGILVGGGLVYDAYDKRRGRRNRELYRY